MEREHAGGTDRSPGGVPSPCLEWQVVGACNHACSYCIQSPRRRRGVPTPSQVDAALSTLGDLPGSWEIKCSGGEAFAFPIFLDRVVPGLMDRTAHTISVLTNFSATPGDLQRFVHLTRGRLRVFSASLHLEFTTLDAFVSKLGWFQGILDPDVDLAVNQVVLPDRLPETAHCRDAIQDLGIRWFPQLRKLGRGLVEYPDPAALRNLLGASPANRLPSYRGRFCRAGVDYLTVDRDGVAWCCRSARRHGEGRLGSILDGSLVRRTEGLPCPYPVCPCSVPANRGIIGP